MSGKKKPCSKSIGRRTGINVLEGKLIRRRDDGIDLFDDYWTDSDSVCSDQTTLTNDSIMNRSEEISANVPIQNSDYMSPMKLLKSSLKKTVNQRSREYGNSGGDFSPRVSKRKSLTFSEDIENTTMARSKMTQTSHLLDETESSPSKSKVHLKEIRINEDGLSDIEKSDSVRKSPRIPSNTFAQNRMEDLPLSMDKSTATNVALPHEVEFIKSKNKSNSRVAEAESSPSRNRTCTEISYLEDTRGKNAGSSHNETNFSLRKSLRVLSNTFTQNRKEDLPLSMHDTNVASPHKLESGKKTKNKSNSRAYEAGSSPSKNRTCTEISYLKETRGKKAGSSHNETNSSLRKSPRGLSNTFTQNRMEDLPLSIHDTNVASFQEMESGKKTKNKSNSIALMNVDSFHTERNSSVGRSKVLSNTFSSNNWEKDNQRNSSGERSSQCATMSSEALNRQENILSRNDSSEILVSHQSESEGKEHVRKSSIGKSPIAVKRKMQSRNALESSPTKTACVQNRRDEGNRRNSSGRRSTQHASKSSEVLNQEESILTRRDRSTNTSEILVFQKEKEQRSPIEKSGASEHNMKQVSCSTDSNMKGIKPVQTARRKIVFSETRKDVLLEKETSPYTGRRSSRKRFPRLASWRNERPKFKKSISGEIKFVGLDEGQPEDDYAYRLLKKKMYKGKNKRIQKPKALIKKQMNIIKKTLISDCKSGKTVELNLHRPFSTCEWTTPLNDESAGYLISKVFSSQVLSFGFLDIAPHSMKDQQFSPRDNIYFVVIKGVVDVVIETTSFTFGKGDSFIVPLGTGYSISNNKSSNALLNYCAFKISFFKYQEAE